MPRPITVDEVASFPYEGIAPSELSPDCELSADGLRVAYTHQNRIHITELHCIHQIHTDLSKEGAQSGHPSSLTLLLS